MKLRSELPHFRATTRDGTAWALPTFLHGNFRTSWMAGRSFWSGFDIWDQPIDVKLADIVAVLVWTEESIALGEEEDAEKKRRALYDGDSGVTA